MPKVLDLDTEKIRKLYVEDEWTDAEIANLLGVCRTTVKNRRKEMGISARSRWSQRTGLSEKACGVCNGSLALNNTIGVCTRPGCTRERARRHSEGQRIRHPEANSRDAKARYQANKHEDMAYLYYSPGLGSYKIGHTTNMWNNENGLRRACWDIQLIDTWPGGKALETWLHNYFADRRIRPRLEWFWGLTVNEVRKAVAKWPEAALVA